MSTGAQKPPTTRSSDVRMVTLNLSSKELVFLQKVTRQEYHFITEDEQQARLRLRDKLLEGFFDQQQNRIVLNLNRDELLFLIKGARENYYVIVRAEKEARLALAAKLHKTAESVFGVTTSRGLTRAPAAVVGTAGHIDHGKSALVRAHRQRSDRLRRRRSAASRSNPRLARRAGRRSWPVRRRPRFTKRRATCWPAPTTTPWCWSSRPMSR